MLNLDDLFVDPGRGEQGVWVDCFSGSKVKLAYSEGKKYKAGLAKLARQHWLQLDDANEESFELIQSITARALAEHILLDWSRFIINGKDEKYTKELGYQVLLTIPKIREFVTEKAADPSTFREQIIEETKKP